MSPARSIPASILALLSVAAPAAAQTHPLATDQPACFGRVYDRTHLNQNPKQKVTSIHVWRSVEDRKEAENYTPRDRQDPSDGFGVDAFVTFKDRRGYFHNGLWCNASTENSKNTICSIDCDGGSFLLEPRDAGTLLLRNNGFVMVGGCGEEVEEAQAVFFDPGADDKVFRLDRKDPSVCLAEEQKAKPLRLGMGKPLRERFAADEAFCFGRDYDAAHLAQHRQQKVASIRVGRLDAAAEREGADPDYTFPNGVKLAVSLKLKGAGAHTARYRCNPLEASWECYFDSEADGDAMSTCDNTRIHLARGPGDEVLLINRTGGLPIEAACAPRKEGTEPVSGKTRSDDRTFRLSRMPVEACR